jgi:hypothetical protein
MTYTYILFIKRTTDNKVFTRYTTGKDILTALENFERDIQNEGAFTVEAIRREDNIARVGA